ncbi:MAG TPA: hypothetical protein VH601_15935 [Bryobacteraceae bacterium]|jgi:hypothetical protein
MTIEIHKPELEALIHERMKDGGFTDVEDVLIQALTFSPFSKQAAPNKPRKKNLAQFLLESPLPGSGLKIERQKDYPRALDL